MLRRDVRGLPGISEGWWWRVGDGRADQYRNPSGWGNRVRSSVPDNQSWTPGLCGGDSV